MTRGVFQSLASMALPAFTIHTLVETTQKLLKTRQNVRPMIARIGPTMAGLACVPALPYLFDSESLAFALR